MSRMNRLCKSAGLLLLSLLSLWLFACKEAPKQPAVVNPEPLERVGKAGGFVAYDEPPMPIGGFEGIQKNLRYPEAARKAGYEGRVILNVLVNTEGKVDSCIVLKSSGREDMDAAAAQAVRSVEWKPALQNGLPVAVWVGLPVVFQLKSGSVSQQGEVVPQVPADRVQRARRMALHRLQGRLLEITREVKSALPDMEGSIVLRISVAEDGELLQVEPAERDRSHPAIRKAMLEKLRNARLFEPQAGVKIGLLEVETRLHLSDPPRASFFAIRWGQ